MTYRQFKDRLAKMSPVAKQAFYDTPGTGSQVNDYLLLRFVDEPRWNERLHHALEEETEADLLADATHAAARHGKFTLRISVATLIVAVVAAVAACGIAWQR